MDDHADEPCGLGGLAETEGPASSQPRTSTLVLKWVLQESCMFRHPDRVQTPDAMQPLSLEKLQEQRA